MIGETVGNFEIVARLGKGGMGEVWLAEQSVVHTRVAIKILDAGVSEDREQVDRFFNQALAAGRIRHPGVGQIFDVGFTPEGRAFLVMEYLEGETLRRRLHAGALAPGRAAEIGAQIASVLVATHAAGVIHRDLKPENIILVRDPTLACGERARLVDFGIAKLVDISQTSSSGQMLGTASYMSPEQWRDVSKVDARSDIYALGCVLFEMLSGRPPFLATSFGEACTQHLNDKPPALPAVPAIVLRMLEKDPAQRPAMADIERDLAALAGHEPVPASSPPPVLRTTRAAHATQATQATNAPSPVPRRSRLPLLVGAGAMIAAIIVGIAISRGGESPVPDARVADDATIPPPIVDADAESIHSQKNTAVAPDRDFLHWKQIPERISGDLPRIYKSFSIRVCFVSATGVVERVAMDDTVNRDHPAIGPVVHAAVIAWRYAPRPNPKRLTCFAINLTANVSKAEFEAERR